MMFNLLRFRQSLDWEERFRQLRRATRNSAPVLRRFYEDIPVPADTLLSEVPLAALDLETTGLDPRRHAIVSLALVPLTLQRIRCAEACYWVVQPDTGLSEQSVIYHHITHSQLEQAPPLSQVLAELLEAMRGRVMVVHYRPIEREFLDRASRRLLGGPLSFPVIDTMELEARYQRGFLARLLNSWRGQRVSLRLAATRTRYGLPLYHAHHALSDALATAELLQAQVAHHYRQPPAVGRLWH